MQKEAALIKAKSNQKSQSFSNTTFSALLFQIKASFLLIIRFQILLPIEN